MVTKTIDIDGKTLTFRDPRPEDAQAFTDYINDLVSEDTFISSKKQTVEDERSYIESMMKKIAAKKELHIAVFNDSTKVGAVDIFSLGVRKEHVGELQIHLKKEYRGKGLGKYLLEEAISQAKKELGLQKIILTCFSVNSNALELYKKYGFKEFGRLPHALKYKSQYIDEVYMYKDLS